MDFTSEREQPITSSGQSSYRVPSGHLTVVKGIKDTNPNYNNGESSVTDDIDGKTLSTLTHEELVVRIAKVQCKRSFRVLFDHYAPRLKSYLLNLNVAASKAESIVQEVMITVWQKSAQFNPEKAKFSTWVFRVARNKHIDIVRKQKYPMVNADDHMSQMVAPEETDKPLESKQTAVHVKEAMMKLVPEQQEVIKLSFFEELSHSAIASRLDLPLGTVKSRIRTAFGVLRKELGEIR